MKYRFVTDQWTAAEWQSLTSSFSDMNIYQTWHYAALHSRGPFRSVSRAAVCANGCIQVMAQLRIKTIPLCNIGTVEADWGPLWHLKESASDESTLGQFLDELRNEYCQKRNLQVRLKPRSTMSEEKDAKLIEILERHGFNRNVDARPYHTIVLDLSLPLETLRKNFHQKWRNQLNKAEKFELIVDFGNTSVHFDRFYALYKEMWAQKRFPTGVRVPIIRQLQKLMPQNERFFVTIVRNGDADIGSTVCTTLGNTMHYFLGASSLSISRDCRPGYLLQWQNIQKAKEMGLRWYDVGGFDDQVVDIARFKRRMNGAEVVYPGQFEALPDQAPSKLYTFAELSYRRLRHVLTGR